MTKFLLIRHCETDWGFGVSKGLVGPGVDLTPLTNDGSKAAIDLGVKLKIRQPDIIVSSPMTRCLQTAALINVNLSLPLEVGFDLHEWLPDLSFNWGGYAQVKSIEAEREANSGEWPLGEAKSWEPISGIRKRALNVLKQYLAYNEVIVVTHSMVINSLTGLSLSYGDTCDFSMESS